MSKKEFDKNEFKKSQDKMAIIFLILFIMGIVSAICGLFVGDYAILGGDCGGGISKGEDPMDYYGTYYTSNDYTYTSFEFNEDECIYTVTNGVTEQKKYYEYEYVSAEYAQTRYADEEFVDCDAIFVYEDEDQERAIVLWVEKISLPMFGTHYEFTIGTTGQKEKLTSSPYNIAEDMNDPKDYYGMFRFDSNNYVSFDENGTALVTLNDRETEYSYIFVNNGWMEKHLKGGYTCDYALAVYKKGSNKFMIFEYYEDYVKYSGEKFYKV